MGDIYKTNKYCSKTHLMDKVVPLKTFACQQKTWKTTCLTIPFPTCPVIHILFGSKAPTLGKLVHECGSRTSEGQ